jgi:hypothetical protein
VQLRDPTNQFIPLATEFPKPSFRGRRWLIFPGNEFEEILFWCGAWGEGAGLSKNLFEHLFGSGKLYILR